MFKFESLEVWKAAVELYSIVVSTTEGLYRRNRGYLADQIRRAALSVSANIAEGTGREGLRESKQFFNIAKGSVYEVVSVAYVINTEGLFSPERYSAIYGRCDHIARMLSGLIRKR
jgi:four helix bundle protein